MLPIRNSLFEHLYVSLKKKGANNFNRRNGVKTQTLIDEIINAGNNHHEVNKPETSSVQKLERRIEALELQNDQLIYFLDFLFDRLPELLENSILEKGNLIENPKPVNERNLSNGSHIPDLSSAKNNFPNPTRREAEVLELLIKGLCAKEIANKLFISETTVITHKKNLKEKFCAKNTVELISKACTSLQRNGKSQL